MRSTLIAIGAAALLAAAPPPAEATRPPAVPPTTSFRHAYAHADCAPWDGPALRLILQHAPVPAVAGEPSMKSLPAARFPRYEIAIWQRDPQLQGWIAIPGKNGMGAGHISFQRAERVFTQVEGRIRILERTPTRLRGELRLALPGGEAALPFDAPVLPYLMPCG